MEEYCFGRIFDSRNCLSVKRRSPYWRVLFSEMADSIESQTLTALNSLLEEMSKIMVWSRCSGDPTSVKCKVNVDSYKTCSVFKGREYSLVRIWWISNCELTDDRRPSKETLCMPGLLYLLAPWRRCFLPVRPNRFKIFTDWHPELVRFPYGAAVPSCRIKCSSHFLRKGVLELIGLFDIRKLKGA